MGNAKDKRKTGSLKSRAIRVEKVTVAFNVLFAVSGLVFICMGLYLFFTFTRTGIAIPGFPLQIPWLLVILGISILVTVLLASLPTEELLYKFFYSSVLFVYGVVELFTGGYLTLYYDTVRKSFKSNILNHIENYLHDAEKLIDSIQSQGCEFMIMYCLNLRLTMMAILTVLLALVPLCGGFLVLLEAYKKIGGYREIPTLEPAACDENVPATK